MSVINTNVKSIVAQNALTVNNRAMSKTMEQLSTGKRINSAADDAAGLAISSKMTSQIKGLNQAVRNANDGISMLQTADDAMIEVTNMMQRMRELAVQSANDTNTSDDREYMDLEFQQLKQEANRITSNTEWNGMKVLDGSFVRNGLDNAGQFKFQVGANASQTIEHTIDQFGFGASTGTAAVTNAVAGAGAQTSTLTIGGTYAEGDVITLNINNQSLQYKVTADDVGGADATANTKLIAASIKDALDEASGVDDEFAGLTTAYTAASAVITFAGAAGDTFDSSSSVSNGQLANISGLSITTNGNSNTAITGLDAALKNVNSARAEIGSKINRLTYAADNLANVSQNTSASRSQVLDTDYASATTELARTQIISQAATAMLAQANQAPQSVLSLLR
jgi:flagellin